MPYKAPGSGREGSAILLVRADGAILLQQRDDDVPPAGHGRWTVPGGGREPGETPRETAQREFEEETGVRLERLRYLETITIEEVPDLIPACLHLFVADDPVPRDVIQVREGLDFQYHHPSRFHTLPMNPGTRQLLARFIASDAYRGTVGMLQPFRAGVGIIALDRWGRALLQLRDADLPPERFPGQWSIPGGLVEPDEPPDAAAFREFEEETGILLESLRLFRVYRAEELPGSLTHVYHIYYDDPDIPEERIAVHEGQVFRYWAPAELAALPVAGPAASVLTEFFASTHYRRLFH